MSDNTKAIYEALQALNDRLDDTGEQLLVDLVEKVRTELRRREKGIVADHLEATLGRWVEFDASPRRPAGQDEEVWLSPWKTPPAIRR